MGKLTWGISALVLLCLQLSASADLGKLKKECSPKDKSGLEYCVFTTEGSKNHDILYYFHGRGVKVTAWEEDSYYPAMLRKRWAEKNFDPPKVVAISFGPVWLLAEKNKSDFSGLYNAVVDKIIPTIELALGAPKKRLLMGESMGGFNATQLALKTNLFNRAALLCPPMVQVSPFSSDADIDKMIKETKADAKKVKELILLAKVTMPSEEEWQKANPLTLVESKVGKDSTKLYVSCGLYDEYGFFPGAEKFASIATKAQPTAKWRPLYGGHCAIDPISVADFLAAD